MKHYRKKLKNREEREEQRFKIKLKEINERLQRTRLRLYSSYVPKHYTIKQLREKSKGNIISILSLRYQSIMHYRNVFYELRSDLKTILRDYRKLLIENYQLRKCKNKKGMRKKLGIKGFKTRIIRR